MLEDLLSERGQRYDEYAAELQINTDAGNEDEITKVQKEFDDMDAHLGFELFIMEAEEDEAKEKLKETVTSFTDQINSRVGIVIGDINHSIKSDMQTLLDSIKQEQSKRNRSIVLEILATKENFEREVRETIQAWKSEDNYFK